MLHCKVLKSAKASLGLPEIRNQAATFERFKPNRPLAPVPIAHAAIKFIVVIN